MIAANLAHALDLKRTGRGWRGPCPVHRGSSFTLTEKDGKVLFFCWSGCDQTDILEELRRRGLWPEREKREFTAAERKQWARAKREAEELGQWRQWAAGTLRHWRNQLWSRSQRAERWMAGEGRRVDMDHPWTLEAIKATTDGLRLGDEFGAALEQLLTMRPDEVRRLRERLAERRAAA